MQNKLHEVIAETTKAAPVALSASDIAARIARNGSWQRPGDGDGTDYTYLKRRPFLPNVRFKVTDKELFAQPVLMNSDCFAGSYRRSLAMKIIPELRELLEVAGGPVAFQFNYLPPMDGGEVTRGRLLQ
ncbi:hypothetical protein ACTJJB_32530 [Chitinophaga sp. 22536]|uniref:hypothetical protein n=1 Tax=unclassified Chitinophaga TaxID=2619133 RepID=UPI003F82423E